MSSRTVSIIGGSGYAGGELLRLLLSHSQVQVKQATSRRFAGQKASVVHPNLRQQTELIFCEISDLEPCNVLFVALPNKRSMGLMPQLRELAPVVIDLGADYRLNDQSVFKNYYGAEHTDSNNLTNFTYGLAEINRDAIRKSDWIACGGCEATAIQLALYPLVKHKLIETNGIIADVKIGSSAAGSHGSSSSHHPERHGVLRSYQPTGHRHQAEISQNLSIDVSMSATAVNIVRGILATIHTQLKANLTEKDVWKAYRSVYGSEPFIRIVKQKTGLYRYPEPKLLWGTNFCDIGFELDPVTNRLVVLSAIDNLVKGTAGQAIQAMNIRLGISEEEGLRFPGLHPV